MKMAVRIAVEAYDGHLTILRFTTHWKGMFGTPVDRGSFATLQPYPSLTATLAAMISRYESGIR
jgi:hypothetical protein